MSKGHNKHHDKKHVPSHLDIAMEKAEAMTKEGAREKVEAHREERIPEAEAAALRDKAAKAGEYYDRLLRTAADFENYKKRAERDREDLRKFATEDLMAELVAVLDNFERAVTASGAAADSKGLAEGVRLIQKQLSTVLQNKGLRQIDALGKPFNPELHEAIAQVESAEHPDGTVIAEHLKGYTLNGRLLRPAAVTVSRLPHQAGTPEQDKAQDPE